MVLVGFFVVGLGFFLFVGWGFFELEIISAVFFPKPHTT